MDIGTHIIARSEAIPPGTMGQTFDRLAELGVVDRALADSLKKAVGFRNIAVHNYDAINWEIVHAIAKDHLGDFAQYAKVVVALLDAGS